MYLCRCQGWRDSSLKFVFIFETLVIERWSKVNKRYDIPLNGLYLSTTICCLLGLVYFGSTAAFNAFTGVATLCLSASYGLPVLILLLRKREVVRNAPYSLGKFGVAINLVTVCWIALAIVIFCMPTAIPVTPTTMSIPPLYED